VLQVGYFKGLKNGKIILALLISAIFIRNVEERMLQIESKVGSWKSKTFWRYSAGSNGSWEEIF